MDLPGQQSLTYSHRHADLSRRGRPTRVEEGTSQKMMQRAHLSMVAAVLLSLVVAGPLRVSGQPQLPGPPGTCNSGCCNLGRTVFEGACSSFANYFKADADTAINEDDSAFQARVNRAPIPSSRCCVDARAYTQYGCSCNSELINAASQRNPPISSNAVKIVGRATRFSICSNSQNGGSIQGGC
ncbi:g3942 [Coccomyxa elongata]